MALAEQIGHKLKGGEVIELVSDLGGGKTTFVRGLARGMGSQDHVHSPSFTLSNVYKSGKLTLYHFDFHRLNEPGIMHDELAEILTDRGAIIVIEWASIMNDLLPASRAIIQIKATGETSRQITAAYPAKLSYPFPNT